MLRKAIDASMSQLYALQESQTLRSMSFGHSVRDSIIVIFSLLWHKNCLAVSCKSNEIQLPRSSALLYTFYEKATGTSMQFI
jgi:hypothetical protein